MPLVFIRDAAITVQSGLRPDKPFWLVSIGSPTPGFVRTKHNWLCRKPCSGSVVSCARFAACGAVSGLSASQVTRKVGEVFEKRQRGAIGTEESLAQDRR